MIGKTLGAWLKEFITLVMIQTIQAFLYAIIIVLIVNVNAASKAGIGNADDSNGAIGLLSVIALTSIFKVEAMVKKIFGIGETKASVKGAMGSIAKTAIAFQMGKRALDNGVKAGKGVAQWNKSRGDMKKANTKMAADVKDNEAANERADETYNQREAEIMATKPAGAERDALIAQAKYKKEDKKAAIKQRYQALEAENKTKLEEIKKSKREGVKMIASSGAESVGGVFGGTAGAIIGGADGDLGEAAQGLMAGIGVGDMIGQATVETAAASVEAVNSVRDYSKKYLEDVGKRATAGGGSLNASNTWGAIKGRWKDNSYGKNKKELEERIKAIADHAN